MSNSVTPREAQRLVASVVRAHNSASLIKVRTRSTRGGLEVSVVGRGSTWFACSTLAQVAAFTDGVSDVEIHRDAPPAREFAYAEEAPAWEAGVAAAAEASREYLDPDAD